MSARRIMTMRAQIQRNQSTKDEYGHIGPPVWVTVADELPCYVWEAGNRIDYGTGVVEIGTPMMLVPLDTELTIDDRILSVIDRRGNELFGMMIIDSSPVRKKTHKVARLKKIA